jgi:hypothetical protein
VTFVVALLVLLAPGAARACAVCTGQDDDSVNAAFLAGTLLLSLAPLAWIGGIVWWAVRRARRLRAEEAAGVIRLPPPSTRPRPRHDAPPSRRRA